MDKGKIRLLSRLMTIIIFFSVLNFGEYYKIKAKTINSISDYSDQVDINGGGWVDRKVNLYYVSSVWYTREFFLI
ncbi:hypothetical protein PL321_03690 [Caloramator sp. mosi_1]|uniref:hypothetical protein n=1 Tax=Caloramator sp. mosi_1 TaxID=3023090 RepID=UPI0023609772|nr:hypothetical protein [Caloramator sp. mosi_1]WDC84758.1 hypothetical protein PL321_03690 [Caloramator sp. mosi_1]